MIKKGIISNIDADKNTASVILPDEDDTVTPLLPIAHNVGIVSVGDKCVVAFFECDAINLADGIIVATY